ncbi:hypothetical protein [Paenibacillus sp. KS-LC4]|uniref:hypothetical protein n=1 Tax=Paenibacillus sp. KS-LC4 TaxID=2979727 RepID=UPI0030CD4F02
MKQNKSFMIFLTMICLVFVATPVYAEKAEIQVVNEGLVTISYEDATNIDPFIEVTKLDTILKEQYFKTTSYNLEQAVSEYNTENKITLKSASYCMSQCEESYRTGILSQRQGDALAVSTFYGYHWNNLLGAVHWTGVGGSTAGFWEGGGTAQMMRIDHTLSFSSASINLSTSPGFSGSGSTSTLTGVAVINKNYHQSSFAGTSASSLLYLGPATHEGSVFVRTPWGSDLRPMASVTID